jgi:hypothetical protein
VKKFGIRQMQMEPNSPWQNRTELTIQEIKKGVRHLMQSHRVPNCLWDFCAVYVCELRYLTVHGPFSMHGHTPYEMTTGQTPDISEYSEFGFYEMLWYYDEMAVFPEDHRKLGRWLGVAHRIGQALCYYLLNSNAQIIVRSTVQKITQDEKKTENTRNAMQEFDQEIASHIGKYGAGPPIQVSPRCETLEVDSRIMFDEYDDEAYGPTEPVEPEAEKPEVAEFTTEAYDKFISAEVMLPQGDILVPAHVVGRKRDQDGNPIGQENANPLLDSRVYEVEFPDGHIEEYAANIIAENIYAEVDAEGNHFLIMDEITGHKADENAIGKDEQWIQIGSNGQMRKMTEGWQLQVLWKNGTTTWEWLRNLKESNPIKVAEYAIAQGIAEDPAFTWWVPFVLKKRDRYISAIGTRYQKRTHKFGIEVPRTIKRAYEIDKEMGTNFWAKAIEREMLHVRPAFEVLDRGRSASVGSKWIPCHMIFEGKMDFTRKAWFVAGGHWMAPPVSLTYSSIVARDSVCLCFLIAALNELDLLAADIGNVYLNADTREKIHTTRGPEFGQ